LFLYALEDTDEASIGCLTFEGYCTPAGVY